MRKKKLLSMCALALAITASTSVSAFAVTTVKGQQAKNTIVNAWKGEKVVSGLLININTPVKNYANKGLVDKIIASVKEGIADSNLQNKIAESIQNNYNDGKSFKELFEGLKEINDNKENPDATTDKSFEAGKNALIAIQLELLAAADKGQEKLNEVASKYFNFEKNNTKLTVGKNIAGELVVSLENTRGIILAQVTESDIQELKDAIARREIKTWADINKYYNIVDKEAGTSTQN